MTYITQLRRYILLFPLLIAAVLVGTAVGRAQTQESAPLPEMVGNSGTAFTYQGSLDDGGGPANGNYDFQFSLWDAVSGGSQVGSNWQANNVAVSEGLFTTQLDFGPVFTGQALFLQIRVRPSGGSYTTLSPRQSLTATPYAAGLVPGAQIIGDGTDPGTEPALHIFNEDDLGIYICTSDNQSNCALPAFSEAGIYIDHAATDGIHVVNPTFDGLRVEDAGGSGVTIDNTVFSGVNINNAGQHGVNIFNPGSNGVWVQSPTFDGLLVTNPGQNGVEVSFADINGLQVNSADLYGLDVDGTFLAGVFRSGINVTGGCNGCLLTTFAVNESDEALVSGDIITVLGTRPSEVDNVPMLMEVGPAAAGQALVGVVMSSAEIIVDERPELDTTLRQLVPQEGMAEPGDYVTILIYGPAQVGVDDTADIVPGDRLTIDENGFARALKTVMVEGIQLAESAPVIGIALSQPDDDGLVWVLVNPQ